MYSNMKYYENICNCLSVIQQNINRKLKSANCWQQTSLSQPPHKIFLLRNVRTAVVQIRLRNRKALLLHLSFSMLKKLERIDKSVIGRYSLIADLCGYAERFVFDLLRKALLLFGFSIFFLFADASTTEILMHFL